MNKTAPDAEEPAVTDNPSVSRSRSTMVVGASRGPGRGVATAFARAGTPVVAVVRATAALRELAAATPGVQVEVADAADPSVPGTLLDRHHPNKLLIVACASPLMRPLHQHTWDTFSANWNTDVRIAFHWLLREALLPHCGPAAG